MPWVATLEGWGLGAEPSDFKVGGDPNSRGPLRPSTMPAASPWLLLGAAAALFWWLRRK